MRNLRIAFAILISALLAAPPGLAAQAAGQGPGTAAGTVVELIPAVNVQRGASQLMATPQMGVQWQDVITTQRRSRARIQLLDGSVLNVGSESKLVVTRHDPDARQTELELNYGRVRSQVTRDARPGASFRVRTPTAVAGVVGTDFFMEFINNITTLIVYSGIVELCDLAGHCTMIAAGMFAAVRMGQQPSSATPMPQQMAMQAAQSTQMSTAATGAAGAAGGAAGAGVGAVAGATGLVTTVAAVASIIVPAVVAGTVSKNADKILVRCQPPPEGSTTGSSTQSSSTAPVCGVKP